MFRLLKGMYPSLSPSGKPRIIRLQHWLVYLEAHQLLGECRAAVKRAEEFVGEVYTKEKERGYQEGLAGAHAEMAVERTRFAHQLEDHYRRVEKDIVDLVCHLVEKIVGDIPEQDRVVRMISRAVANLKDREKARVYVCSQHVQAVDKSIRAIYRNYDAPGSLTVESNDSLTGDQCIVEAGGLVVEISLASYLEALKRSIHVPKSEEII